MKALELIMTTRAYLDYVEEHLNNVWKAFKEVEEKCKGMRFIWDDFCFHTLRGMVEEHDCSKMSAQELTQYRDCFFPLKGEDKKPLGIAWVNHKANNDHHWQNWTDPKHHHPYYQELCCAHMIIDWLAMSYKFGGSPREYYEKNKDDIKIPDWAIRQINEIFDCLDGKYICCNENCLDDNKRKKDLICDSCGTECMEMS